MICQGKGGLQYDLSVKPLAAGGEGEIYDITGQPGLVAKIYKPGKASLEKEKKLVKMVNESPDKSVLSQIAWPQDVLYNAGQFVGFAMPKMKIYEDLNVIYEYGSAAKYPQMPWENKLIIAENLCAVLDCVHAAGHTCGDFNPKNISVNPKTGHVMFLDTDSYHIQDGADIYRCDVGIPEYLPVEIQMKMRGGSTLSNAKLPTFSQNTDNFALAIHIFQLLMNGVHPFACAIIPSQSSVVAPQPSDNIIKGEFPFMQNLLGIRIPSYAPPITILPQALQNLFGRAFNDGHLNPGDRPEPAEWHKALRALRNELKTCGKVSHHQYYNSLSTCPWCDVDSKFAQQFKPKASLSQTTIKAFNIPAAPIVTAPAAQLSATPFESMKQKFMELHIGIRALIIAIVVIVGINVIKGVMSDRNYMSVNNNSPVSVGNVANTDTTLADSKQSYETGIQAMADMDYPVAIAEFRNVSDQDRDYSDAQEKLTEAMNLYREAIFASCTELEASESYAEIINSLNAALKTLPKDEEISSKLTYYTELMYTKEKEFVLGEISQISSDASSSQDYDSAITSLKELLVEYPAFNAEIDTDVTRFTTELINATKISLDKPSMTLVKDASDSLSVVTNPANIKNLEYVWESSNPAIVSVSNNGRVMAKGFGTADIVLSVAGASTVAVCEVQVEPPTKDLAFSTTISDSITMDVSINKYTFTLEIPGNLDIALTTEGDNSAMPNKGIDIRLSDSNGAVISGTNDGLLFPYSDSFNLEAGAYYLEVIGREGVGNSGKYNIRTDYFIDEIESNNTRTDAQSLISGLTVRGAITAQDLTDIYSYNLELPGRLTIDMDSGDSGSGGMGYVRINWYDADGNSISHYDINNSGSVYMDLEAGIYYIEVIQRQYSSATGTYSLRGDFTSAKRTDGELGNSRANAKIMSTGVSVIGLISQQEKINMFQYELVKPGRLSIDIDFGNVESGGVSSARVVWYDTDGNPIKTGDDSGAYSDYMDLDAGTYFIEITQRQYSSATGSYNLVGNIIVAGNNETEPNSTRSEAQLLTAGQSVKGLISYQDKQDMYRYELSQSGRLSVQIALGDSESGEVGSARVIWYDVDGNPIKTDGDSGIYSDYMDLDAGTYFIEITQQQYSSATGTYVLTVDA